MRGRFAFTLAGGLMRQNLARVPVAELFRVMRWGRDQGYDHVLRGESPIPVHRVRNRYLVNADDLAKLCK
jgi:hypothetical protein